MLERGHAPASDNVRVDGFDRPAHRLLPRARHRSRSSRACAAAGDFDYELQMAQMNSHLAGVETVFVPDAARSTSFLASAWSRRSPRFGGDVTGLVPDFVREQLVAAARRARRALTPRAVQRPFCPVTAGGYASRGSVSVRNRSDHVTSLDPRAPLVLDTRELGRRPGSQREVDAHGAGAGRTRHRSPACPRRLAGRARPAAGGGHGGRAGLRHGHGRARRGMRTVPGADRGRDRRRLQELFVYDDQHDQGRGARRPDLDDEASRLEDDLLDLEPLLRDAVVLALPFQPLCEDDCPGLCVECGARLADDPDHAHEEPIDPRWAGLEELTQDAAGPPGLTQTRTGTTPADARQHTGEDHGCPEAEDVAQQHAPPSVAVEGRRADPRDLRQPRLRRQAPARTARAAPCGQYGARADRRQVL